MPKDNKANKVIAELRINAVAEWLIEGCSRKQILQNVAKPINEALFQISERQLDNYIKMANDRILSEAPVHLPTEIKKAKRRYEKVIHDAFTGPEKDLRAAVAAQKQLDTLLGTNAPRRVDVGVQRIVVGIKRKD